MSPTEAAAATTDTAETAREHALAGLGRAVGAEWIKFRTIRSSFYTLLACVALTVGAGAAFVPLVVEDHRDDPAGRTAGVAARHGWWFHGMEIGFFAVMILGVLVATSEYSTGTMRATLAAVPSRGRVLAAKVVCLGAVTFVAGAVQAAAAFLVARPILAARSIDMPLTDPAAWQGVAVAALAIMGAALFGLGAGLLIRHTAGAIAAAVAVLMVVVSALSDLLPASWNGLAKVLPPSAMDAMVTPTGSTLARLPATAVFLGYTALILAAAGLSLARRDA
jgi:hypothetical protein